MSKAKGKRVKGRQGKQEDERETLAFKVLNADNTKKLADIEDVDDLQEALAEVLQITNHPIDLKEGAVVDYYVAGFWWGKEQGYSHEQLSAFYSVIHTLLENIKDKQMSITDNLKEFRKMLAGIGQDSSPEVKTPSGGLETLFDVNHAKDITDYVYTSLFQHYRLFEFITSHTQAEEIIGTDLEIEIPPAATLPWPPPLDEAVSEEMYVTYIVTPPPTSADEEAEGADGTGVDEVPIIEGADEDDKDKMEREADILAQLTSQEVQSIMDSVFEEMLGGVKNEVAAKLREKENTFINRVNKIHNVAE